MEDPLRCDRCGTELPDGAAGCPDCDTLTEERPAFPAISGYRILRALGAGGMGAVYLAEDVTLGRQVAVKVVAARVQQSDTARERFLREARSMAAVEHPNVVHVYSYGNTEGHPYLVMEHVAGETLSARIRRVGGLPIAEALDIARQTAMGLEAAWERGIVHRDVKPPNILIDAKERVRVADFGLAKALKSSRDASVTQNGTFVGTPSYISPEQARGNEVDFRSDIYSLGIVLYEMIAGSPPFRGPTPIDVVAQHLGETVPPLSKERPETPPGVVRLVEQMTEKDRDKRPASYAALRAAIEESAGETHRWVSGSPYRGLAPFDFEHASVFFGRTQAAEDVVRALVAQAEDGRGFLLVLGMSGSGKSSLVRAGVLPRLAQGTIPEARLYRRAILRPGDVPGDLFEGLGAALLAPDALPELGADGTTAREVGRLLRENPLGAALLAKGGLSQAAAGIQRRRGLAEQPDVRLVLVVDQMEEMFTLPRITVAERVAFVSVLAALARSGRAWVVGTLRSDHYGRCEELPELMALKAGTGQYHMAPPTPAEIGQMIREPARAAGLRFEEEASSRVALDEVLRDAAVRHVGNLPLLEFALDELYRQRTADGLLTHSAYRSFGGVEGALNQRAEEVFASLPLPVQAALPEVFPALARVASGQDETFSRKYAVLESFTSGDAQALVDAFIGARLFVSDLGRDGRAVVSIAHEALFQSWPRLRTWLDENQELLRVRGRIGAAAALWHENGHRSDLLLADGRALEEALPLVSRPGVDLSDTERRLIEASEVRVRGRRRARQIMNVNSVVLLGGATVAYIVYLWKVIPPLAQAAYSNNEALPLAVRVQITLATWTKHLSPLLIAAAVVLYLLRRRIKVPEFIGSGMGLAVLTGLALLLSLLGFLMALLQVASFLPR
jgi:predicted Ser/Thr protein kinase